MERNNRCFEDLLRSREEFLHFFFFFFDKSKYYIKKRRGARPLVHWEYTKGTREGEKKERKSTKLIACGASQPVVQE
jgi:hypothetical protein